MTVFFFLFWTGCTPNNKPDSEGAGGKDSDEDPSDDSGEDTATERCKVQAPLVDLAPGLGTYCAVDTVGCLECWHYEQWDFGSPATSVTLVPGGLFKSVSLQGLREENLGDPAGCAVDMEGHLQCWQPEPKDTGFQDTGFSGSLVNSPSQDVEVTSVSADTLFPCATRVDGGVYCWGKASGFQTDLMFRDVAVDWYGEIGGAITEDGVLVTWEVVDSFFSGFHVWPERYTAFDMELTTLCVLLPVEGLTCWMPAAGGPTGWHVTYPDLLGRDVCLAGPGLGGLDEENCILHEDGTVTCRTLTPTFDLPLSTLSCSYDEGGVICGITETGEGRCWGPYVGMWTVP